MKIQRKVTTYNHNYWKLTVKKANPCKEGLCQSPLDHHDTLLSTGNTLSQVVDTVSRPGTNDWSSSVSSGDSGGIVGNLTQSLRGESRFLVDIGFSRDLLVDVWLSWDLDMLVWDNLRCGHGTGDNSEENLRDIVSNKCFVVSWVNTLQWLQQ